jgi:sugar/nucleoside kinase (ribokinase family)
VSEHGRAFDVVVVGNVGVDTSVFLQRDGGHGTESTFTENVDSVGQAGGYTSRGFAALGLRTAFIGHVGEDHSGRWVREELAGDGVDLTGLFVDPSGTARSVNLIERDGSRRNFYDGKGHLTLRLDPTICASVLVDCRLALFHLPNWAREFLPVARAAGATIACDLQDVVSLDDPYRRDFLDHADIVFFSAVNSPDPQPLVRSLLAERPDRIVLSGLGPRGCAVGTADGVRLMPPIALDVPVADTNGAGDALAVGFLASYVLQGHTLDDAVRRGQIAARWTCGQRATSAHLITATQLDAYDHALRAP